MYILHHRHTHAHLCLFLYNIYTHTHTSNANSAVARVFFPQKNYEHYLIEFVHFPIYIHTHTCTSLLEQMTFFLIIFLSTHHILLGENDKKQWTHIVWNRLSIPKHKFTMWVACLDRLPTKVRLHHFGVLDENSCTLCGAMVENRDHLFFQCSLGMQIWELVMGFVQEVNPPYRWQDIIDWMIAWKGSESIRRMKRAAVAACIYHIWWARNLKIFQDKKLLVEEILHLIIFEVKILCTKVVKMKDNSYNRAWCTAMKVFPEFVVKHWAENCIAMAAKEFRMLFRICIGLFSIYRYKFHNCLPCIFSITLVVNYW